MTTSAKDLEGRSIICTGAGSGIGRSAAVIASRRGAAILVADINEDGGRETVEMIRREGGRAEFQRADISKEDEVERMVAQALSHFGELDGAFNNAAVAQKSAMIHELTPEQWRVNMDVTLTGTFLCMKHELRAMMANGRGAIVNTSSGAGLRGFKMGSEYSAAKHGVVGLTRTAALEYSGMGIRINAIAPGGVRTPMLQWALDSIDGLEDYMIGNLPIGRIGEPDELGEAAVWLLSDAASFITGATLPVDGGYMA
ncbi:SDR family oxidoreductase [Sphingobium phenoxybenzoativorans]|uniref:SDR family oxidoreductase n=1 Tax=Sphingobium phenoxybenzoativorans TaxID=1592790 RepID=A0A975K6P3_9SPHN|nr:SDR family oxidoreductase [Sphingobium phenoxybenzoativorans]QUT05798.1 SDR family oxidoreductase [Sphingobium phenoxybenzoativorans]